MKKWLEDILGITELKDKIINLQVVIKDQESEIRDHLQKIRNQTQQLSRFGRKIGEAKEMEERAIKAEQALAPTKKSLEVLTAERSKWQRKIKRLENKK